MQQPIHRTATVLMTADAVGGVWTYAVELTRAMPEIDFVLATMGLNRTIPGTFAGWLIAALWIAFVIQIFLSIRYVYRQGWFISTLKFFTGGVVYLVVLLVALAATFFITLVVP